ncbi:uncharacterized protein LOC117119644 [Anneissia japonica]|uniref:uncharacterized protein LOC117119644 n=1 Tax=Anneissia japonica TaxID=1529436 RepID=UPI00142550D9|nr:uncharacterized protein LOC117119644 [Anneissia japonica]
MRGIQDVYTASKKVVDFWGYDNKAVLYSSSIGAFVFPVSLGLIQHTVFRILAITNGSIFASALGLAAVGMSGCAASVALTEASDRLRERAYFSWREPSYSALPKPYSLNNHEDLKLLTVYFIGTVVVFKACRGRFSSVLPSSVKHPGAFANVGIVGSHRYAHKSQRVKIMQMGRKLGCHTCGRKWFSKSFIADHQPPLALSHNNRGKKYLFGVLRYPKTQQKLYPQCKKCSLKQQKHIQSPKNYSAVVTHASSLRIYHLFLPLPYIWAFIRDVAYYI